MVLGKKSFKDDPKKSLLEDPIIMNGDVIAISPQEKNLEDWIQEDGSDCSVLTTITKRMNGAEQKQKHGGCRKPMMSELTNSLCAKK